MNRFRHSDAIQLDIFREAIYSVNEKTLCFPDPLHFCKFYIPQTMKGTGIHSGICLNPIISQENNNNRIQNLTACPGIEYIETEPKKEANISNINNIGKGRVQWKK